MELAKQAARVVKCAWTKILTVDVLAVVRSGLVSIYFAVMRDGGSMLMGFAMEVSRIESAMRLGLPESGTIACAERSGTPRSHWKRPFRKAAMSVCLMRKVLWLRDMIEISG